MGEIQQGKNLVDAAKVNGVKHFVWSTLDRGKVVHFNTKADINDYLTASGVPYSSLYTCWFLDNMLGGLLGIKKDGSGGIVMKNDWATGNETWSLTPTTLASPQTRFQYA